jgi:hypothetical protein
MMDMPEAEREDYRDSEDASPCQFDEGVDEPWESDE